MDQKPLHAEEPFDPPTAGVAKAYLNEVGAVVGRREVRINRRAMARQNFISGIALALYTTMWALVSRSEAGAGATQALPLVVPLLFWTQLQRELQESYGYRPGIAGRRRSWVVILAVTLIGSFMLIVGFSLVGIEYPFFLVFVPGLLGLIVFGVAGVRELRLAKGTEPPVAAVRRALTRSEQVASAVLGLVLGLMIVAIAFAREFAAVSSVAAVLGMLTLVGWLLASMTGAVVPALGAAWRGLQWAIFAAASLALVLLMLVATYTTLVTPLIGGVVGAVVVLLFIAVSFMGGRSER